MLVRSLNNTNVFNMILDFSATRSCQTNLNYTGQMIFERIGNREWLAKFIVVKDVSILTQVIT